MSKKDKIKWIANERAVYFFDNWQAVEYNRYSFVRFNGIEKMRDDLMRGCEIHSWSDVFALAAKYGGRGESCSIEKAVEI